ncbi:MAG: acetyltransferase [Actinomycetota bacterium]
MTTSWRLGMFGASGHASDLLGAAESVARARSRDLTALLYVDEPFEPRRFADRPAQVVGGIEDASPGSADEWLVAVGYPRGRAELVARLATRGFRWARLIHDRSTIGTGVVIGEGSVLLAGATLSPLVDVGAHAYLSQGVSVGHDTVVGECVSVMPNATVGGDCIIEPDVLIGSGATVLEKIRIGRRAVVGAGAVVTKDVGAGETVLGSPAKVVTTE